LRRFPIAWIHGMIFGLYAVSLIIFFTTTRYRAPLFVILIPYTAIGFSSSIECILSKVRLPVIIYAASIIIFISVQMIPLSGKNDMTAYINTHAINLYEKQHKEAIETWEYSSSLNGRFSDFANLALANIYYGIGKKDKAYFYVSRIADDSFVAYDKYNILGDFFHGQENWQKAVEMYEKALNINYGLRQTREKLIRILSNIDPEKAKKHEDELRYVNSFYDFYLK